jgi:hypothetical protein
MTRSRISAVLFMVALAASQAGQGCGGNGNGGSSDVTFTGNVANVSPAQAMNEGSHRWLARVGAFAVPDAVAQTTCPVKHILACATNGTADPAVCHSVDIGDCRFSVSVTLPADDFAGSFGFVDDQNGNGKPDQGEPIAFLFTPLGAVCRGMVVTLTDVTIDFTSGFSTATSVTKNPDTCPTPTPGGTQTPGGTHTPGIGGTPTPTPTYAAGASLNTPPSSMLAMLYALGAVGMLLPRSRSKKRDD